MSKKILTAIVVLSLMFIFSCSRVPQRIPSSSPSPEIVRKAELGSKWQMYQLKAKLTAGDELSILLRLTDGDKVDGYFYLEEGGNVDFRVTGTSLVYKLEAQDGRASGKAVSERFSFAASQTQGSTYTLNFRNIASDRAEPTKVTIFLEIIYPVTGSIFIPLETK